MSFPKEFLRGIPNNQFINDENCPTSDLFYFNPNHQKTQRDDDYIENSINWRDDTEADKILFEQTNNGEIQFKGGAAIMCHIEFENLCKKPLLKEKLSFERQVLEGNQYHGNLLLKSSISKKFMHQIAATIATTCFIEIIPNPNF